MSPEIYKSIDQPADAPLFNENEMGEADKVLNELNNDTVAKLKGLIEKGGKVLSEIGKKFLGPKEMADASSEFQKEISPGIDDAMRQDGNVPEDVCERYAMAMHENDNGPVRPEDFLKQLEAA